MAEADGAGGARGLIRRWLDGVYGMDTRALAAFRVALGLLLLLDIGDRAGDLIQYTDQGAFPRSYMSTDNGRFSLHALSGEAWWPGLLFAVQGLGALAVLVGWHSRLALGVVWVLISSLHTRHPHVLYGGDIELRLLCFWGLFLPLGARGSVDAWRGRVATAPRALSVGTAALLWQLAWIYISTVDLKSGAEWHNGQAVWYALHIDQFTQASGRWLLQFPNLLSAMTHVVFWFEALGPWVVLLVPEARVRTVAVLGFMGMHLGFELCMEIGLFPWISMVGWIPALPAWFWDRLRVPQLPGAGGAPWRAGRLNEALAALGLIYISWWNLGSMYGGPFGVRGEWRRPANALRIDQLWDMFAPRPLKDDGWWILQGNRRDGETVDLQRGGLPVNDEKPEDIWAIYKNERWRKYMRNLWNKDNARLRKPFAHWLCRDYNAHAAPHAQLRSVQLIYMEERTQPPGTPITIEPHKVGLYNCPDQRPKADATAREPDGGAPEAAPAAAPAAAPEPTR